MHQVVKWLVSHGAKVSLRDKFGGSALLDAMTQGTEAHVDIMVFLSQQGAELVLEDPAGELCQAAADGDHDKLHRVLEMGISPNVADYGQAIHRFCFGCLSPWC
jgi:ankyrin repeat protein